VGDLLNLWNGFGAETKAAIIQGAATLLAALLGFGAIFFQLRSQGRQARDGVAENERRRLKAAMYEDAVAVCRRLADSAIDMSTYLHTLNVEIAVAAGANELNMAYDVPQARYPAILDLHRSFSEAALRFIFLIESRQFVDPRIVVFRTAFNSVLRDTRHLMTWEFFSQIVPVLPTEAPSGELYPYTPPSPTSLAAIRRVTDKMINVLRDAIMYTDDFLVEMQNSLMGDLFEHSVPARVPVDASGKVISLRNANELEQWFRTQTEWGRETQALEAGKRESIAPQA
jgi:hypothetical protein